MGKEDVLTLGACVVVFGPAWEPGIRPRGRPSVPVTIKMAPHGNREKLDDVVFFLVTDECQFIDTLGFSQLLLYSSGQSNLVYSVLITLWL